MVLAVAACKKQGPSEVPVYGEIITAHIGGGLDSKVEFDSNGKFSWNTPDYIAIHTSQGSYKTVEVNSSGVFTFYPDEGEVRDGYAFYPAAVAGGSTDAPIVTLPASYDAEEMTGDKYPTPMIAFNNPDDADLWFYHLGGAFHLTLNGVPAGTKALVVSMGKGITGPFTVNNPDSKKPFITCGDTPDEVSFVFAEALPEDGDGIIINVPLPVGTYPRVTVSAKDASNAVLAQGETIKEWFFPRGRGRHHDLDLE